jgi:putative addiction module CopG family antidote
MGFSLNPDLERLIAEKVRSGRYKAADEVVREGLRLLEQRESEMLHSPSNGNTNLAAVFESIANEIPDDEWQRVPSGLSKNIDGYLYGGQKRS